VVAAIASEDHLSRLLYFDLLELLLLEYDDGLGFGTAHHTVVLNLISYLRNLLG
jgi:hypothetical protein